MNFSRKELTRSSSNITERLGDEGYAFANVNSIPDINEEAGTVAITYFIDPGKRAYVRRLTFEGNTKTRDEVLRREMRQLEGGWISTKNVQRSKVRLQRLGYFKEVNVETPAVPGATDQVDVKFSVEENPSGNLLFGLGFSQSQGVIFNTSVTQDNFLGSGKQISFAFNNSDVNRRFQLGYTNPYYTIDGVSRGFNVGYTETNANNANITVFDSKVINGGVSFGIPVTEHNFFRTAMDYEATEIDANSASSQEVLNFLRDNGDSYNVLRWSSSFSYDTRNKAVLPDKGTLHRITTEVAIPGGDLRYYKLDYRAQWFHAITENYTFLLKGELGYGDSYGDTVELPFFENFYAGGPRTVRGYEENTLGPVDSLGRALGGDLKVVANAEVILPIPFFEDISSVRVTGFTDIGNIYGVNEEFAVADLRGSFGISGLWLSPFGVMTVSFAQPFNDQATDKLQSFQFTFGTSF
jgi:outer membrane protein insertion porin family